METDSRAPPRARAQNSNSFCQSLSSFTLLPIFSWFFGSALGSGSGICFQRDRGLGCNRKFDKRLENRMSQAICEPKMFNLELGWAQSPRHSSINAYYIWWVWARNCGWVLSLNPFRRFIKEFLFGGIYVFIVCWIKSRHQELYLFPVLTPV